MIATAAAEPKPDNVEKLAFSLLPFNKSGKQQTRIGDYDFRFRGHNDRGYGIKIYVDNADNAHMLAHDRKWCRFDMSKEDGRNSYVLCVTETAEAPLLHIDASTEAAKIIQAHAGDDKDARSEALTAMVQTELFEAILALQEADEIGEDGEKTDPGERVALLSKAAKNIATLTRSSINLKEFQAKVETAARKKALEDASQTAATTAKQQGLSATGVEALRAAIMGQL